MYIRGRYCIVGEWTQYDVFRSFGDFWGPEIWTVEGEHWKPYDVALALYRTGGTL